MRVEEFRYTCGRCGHVFTAPATVWEYGRLFLRSGGGRMAFLDTFADPAWADAERLLAQVSTYTGLPDWRRGDVFQRGVVPLLYDRDDEGFELEVGGPPRCASCGGRTMSDWTALNPARLIDLDLPAPTSQAWFARSEEDRLRVLREVVVDTLSG